MIEILYIHIVHGDITTISGNIKNKLAEMVRSYADSTHLKKVHFQEVIHIVDMDGVYIPDSEIIEDAAAADPIYNVSEIRTHDPEGIKSRNKRKRKNLDVISQLPSVWGGVPYQVYYMSCNLEHVLYDKLNCTDIEKERYAFLFAKKYKGDIPGFISFIADSEFSVSGDYLETWEFIKQEKHSLERHTNIGICLRPKIEYSEGD